MGSVLLLVVLLTLPACPAQALGAQDPNVLCGGECGCWMASPLRRGAQPSSRPGL